MAQFLPNFGRPKGWESPVSVFDDQYPELDKLQDVDLIVQRPSEDQAQGLSSHDLHWLIQWLRAKVKVEDTPDAQTQLLWRRIQLVHEAGVDHLTNWGAISTYGEGGIVDGSERILIKAMSKSERIELEAIANATQVCVPDGHWNCQDWLKTVLMSAVDRGLLSTEEYERAVRKAESISPIQPQNA
ncbi:hypothetical protein BKA70DRAFT_1250903 [Coprinopsis sp. MPI-PUGE-AT-0042]|nr:hypothetical protein BKA70DRAFT_1250903 [Coprinopsis sp. MPI-PUGE-AT-0042]